MKKSYISSIRILGIVIFQICAFLVFPNALAVDSNGDNIDDDLVVSFAEAGIMNFPDSDAGETETISEIDFDSDLYNDQNVFDIDDEGNLIPRQTAGSLVDGSTIQARMLFGANANTMVDVGTGSGALTQSSNPHQFNVFGGAGGSGNYITASNGDDTTGGWTLTFTNTQRYIGLWWSAGNAANNLQLLDNDGNNILSPAFTTGSIENALLDGNLCPAERPTAAQINAAAWRGYCGNPVIATSREALDPNNQNYCIEEFTINNQTRFRYCYVNEPFAFIHLRFEDGFNRLRVWGQGFEMDNLTFSETIPDTGETEETVGNVASDGPLPDVLLVDPRATTLSLPASNLSGSNNANICFVQVANNTGGALSGSATIAISQNTSITGITATVGTNSWRYSGTRAVVEDQIPELRINGVSGNPVATTASRWIRIRLTHDTADADCETTNPNNQQQIVEIRPLTINSSQNRNVSIQ